MRIECLTCLVNEALKRLTATVVSRTGDDA